MASLDDWEVVDKLGPGFAALVLGVLATMVAKTFYQLTGHRNYWWFVGPGIAVTYALVFAFHLRGRCAGLPFTQALLAGIRDLDGLVPGRRRLPNHQLRPRPIDSGLCAALSAVARVAALLPSSGS